MPPIPPSRTAVLETVDRALAEDLGPGDLSLAAVPNRRLRAVITAHGSGILCGRPYVEALFERLGGQIGLTWGVAEGGEFASGTELATLSGPVHTLLSGERTALNLLQTLSGTATATARLVAAVAGTEVRILDTRKTIPGLRTAQKYAVRVGGGHNHRHGLYDGVLLKENHLAVAGGVATALTVARAVAPHTACIQIEVEDLDQFRTAQAAGAEAVLLDHFSLADLRTAVAERRPHCFLEASGDLTAENIAEVAATRVDGISVGRLTRDLISLDLSLEFTDRL